MSRILLFFLTLFLSSALIWGCGQAEEPKEKKAQEPQVTAEKKEPEVKTAEKEEPEKKAAETKEPEKKKEPKPFNPRGSRASDAQPGEARPAAEKPAGERK